MRPLPRVHAYTDARVITDPDFGIRAAAIAASGPAVALHARAPDQTAAFLTAAAARLLALARPPEAAVLVSGRSDIAAGLGAQGVQLGGRDLNPADARAVLGSGWIGCSVHSREEAERAVNEGADFLVVGSIYPTASHAGRPPAGLELIREAAGLGVPVIAIGGITPARAREVRAAGAWGVAAIGALWQAADPATATLNLLEPWTIDRE
jgi:thiamine-phosphate pyrophosphorylase